MPVWLMWMVPLMLTLQPAGKTWPVEAEQMVPIQIEIVADSVNVIRASVTVKPGTPARELMNRLFQMKYADWRQSFVTGIAGFEASKRKRQYWALSIDGEYAKVGIAAIKITEPMRIRWILKTY
ncbi:MAG: DUF4430 domain-containing protein [candidate division KSB1 bacterium]|nr:DUF4430 domain-containing protein [candidate division KSB1 bacterium]MDQ7063830.1 DUF4430 domain-containing protein [candidate division KSB1 bacterium]